MDSPVVKQLFRYPERQLFLLCLEHVRLLHYYREEEQHQVQKIL